jgi:hypothetical protein
MWHDERQTMASYTIVITSESTNTQTSVVVEDSDGSPRILEIVVKAIGESELHTLELPPIDLDLLVRSLLPPAPFAKPAAVGGEQARPVRPDEHLPANATPHQERQTAGPQADGATTAASSHATGKSSAGSGAPVPKRAYRRMPDDLLKVYEQTNSVTAVASHYNVPRHTAQGWIDRLRRASPAA